MYQIWDQQTGALLADGMEDLTEARERLEELLAHTRARTRARGDSVEGMWLEWVIADPDGRIVVGHHGEPVPWPGRAGHESAPPLTQQKPRPTL